MNKFLEDIQIVQDSAVLPEGVFTITPRKSYYDNKITSISIQPKDTVSFSPPDDLKRLAEIVEDNTAVLYDKESKKFYIDTMQSKNFDSSPMPYIINAITQDLCKFFRKVSSAKRPTLTKTWRWYYHSLNYQAVERNKDLFDLAYGVWKYLSNADLSQPEHKTNANKLLELIRQKYESRGIKL